jgi:hypothetical protein
MREGFLNERGTSRLFVTGFGEIEKLGGRALEGGDNTGIASRDYKKPLC